MRHPRSWPLASLPALRLLMLVAAALASGPVAAAEPPLDASADEAPAPADPVGDAAPTAEPAADAPPPTPAPKIDDVVDDDARFAPCHAELARGDAEAARRCFAAIAGGESVDEQVRIARELADLVGSLSLAPAPPPPPRRQPGFELDALLDNGKAELAVTSGAAGAWCGLLGGATLVFAASGLGVGDGGSAAALLLLGPVLGGAAGLAAAGGAIALWPTMSTGDAHVIRAFLLLGGADSAFLGFFLGQTTAGQNVNASLFTAGMLLTQLVVTGAGVGLAVATELPEGAPSLGLSAGLWAPVIGTLALNMFGAMPGADDSAGVTRTLALLTNAGFAGGLALGATVVPVTRAETWAADIGGGVGLLVGAAAAIGWRAPNPFTGYGTMVGGTLVGMAGGVALAKLVPPWLETLPEVVAFSPTLLPDRRGTLAWGGALQARF